MGRQQIFRARRKGGREFNLKTSPSRIVLLLLLASTLITFMPNVAYAPVLPTIYVNPQSISDPDLTPGANFTLDIKIHLVDDLFAYEIKMGYNKSILSPIEVNEGPFIKDQTTSPSGTFFAYIIDDEYVYATCVTLGKYPGVSGSGILLNVTFIVSETGECDLPLYDTILLDSNVDEIAHDVVGGYFSNIPLQPIAVYTDKYSYSSGETMYLGLDINNPVAFSINVCIAVWLERPSGPIIVILHAHAVTLPGGFSYSNPSFSQFVLPPIPPGNYTWHAALLRPSPHAILIEDTADWEFV